MTNSITSGGSFQPTQGHYQGTEIYNTGTNNWYAVKTRYDGRLSRIRFNLPLPSSLGECFTTNNTYTITMNMATSDWRNKFGSVYVGWGTGATDWSTGSITYVSEKKIYFKFKIPASDTNCYDFVFVDLKSTNLSSTAFTGVSNWNLSKITLTDSSTSSSGGGSGSSPTPTPKPDYSDIINNNTQNTQDIINNNNENTSNIIENNNQNTQEIKDTINTGLNTCRDSSNILNITADTETINGVQFSKRDDGTIVVNGTASSNTFYYLTGDNYDSYLASGSYFLNSFNSSTSTSTWRLQMMFENSINDGGTRYFSANTSRDVVYGGNYKAYIVIYNGYTANNLEIRPMLSSGALPKPYEKTGLVCVSKLDDQTNAINNINDSINNSNVESGTGQGFFDDFSSNDFGLSSIITIPLNTIQSLTSKSCLPLQVPIPFTDSNLTLPCMTEIYEQRFGSVYNLWKIVSFGIVAYLIAIDIFHIVKGFKDPESDKVEVLDL